MLSTFLNVYYLLANVIGALPGPFIKFWLNDKLIFRKSRHEFSLLNPKIQD